MGDQMALKLLWNVWMIKQLLICIGEQAIKRFKINQESGMIRLNDNKKTRKKWFDLVSSLQIDRVGRMFTSV